jgi:hypothetical protein
MDLLTLQREEEARLRRLRQLIDGACARLRRQVASPHEAVNLIVETKGRVLELFPDKAAQFDLIYLPRMLRLVRQRWSESEPASGQPTPALL